VNLSKRNKKIPKIGANIGLTGSIASGKSYILTYFKKLGFNVFDADKIVHKLLLKNGDAYNKVAKIFPECVENKGINRKKLGDVVLHNNEKLQKLEFILHPLVRKEQKKLMKATNSGGKSTIYEVQLLFENKREKYFDFIILAKANIELQKKRAMERNNMTSSKFDAIINRFLNDEIKVKKADFIIDTTGSTRHTIKQIKEIIE
jgi:dephospho-CoA kinase